MYRGITRISTPATLIRGDDELGARDVTETAAAEMHGYGAGPSHPDEHFGAAATPEVASSFGWVSDACCWLPAGEPLQVRAHLLSERPPTKAMLKNARPVATEWFAGRYGDHVTVTSGMTTGTAIFCNTPEVVCVERVELDELLDEFEEEVEAMLSAPSSMDVEHRAGHFGAICWMETTFEELLSESRREGIRLLVRGLESLQYESPTARVARELRRQFAAIRN